MHSLESNAGFIKLCVIEIGVLAKHSSTRDVDSVECYMPVIQVEHSSTRGISSIEHLFFLGVFFPEHCNKFGGELQDL